ncbi:MAG: polysaccharide biosynthesis C-terminal domain-containing protein [Eubacteriales bacterium]|nr:polysaccharide biosynthesis C-terminal domain-containing protein [Eubacteriales bacterium]
MKAKSGLLKNAAIICAFSLACRGSGMLFRLYLSNRIGSEGIGLYQLVLSIYSLFASFATAGIGISVSKIAAEELEGGGGTKGAEKALKTASRLALSLGVLSMLSLLALSSPFSKLLLGDSRTLLPLRILSLSMPFMAMSSSIKGYFIASRRVMIPASSQLFEELCKIGLNMVIISFFLSSTTDIGKLCIGITTGLACGEVFSFFYVYSFWFFGKRYRFNKGESRFCSLKRITEVALPNAAGSWLTNGLHTAENLLIPYCFALYGGSEAKALSDFGLIRGMVIPVLFFPFAFLSALISILIPEISRLNTFSDKTARDMKMQKTLRVTFIFGIAAGGIFFFFPEEISRAFYHSAESARAFRLLAAVTPFMYIETITDGLLKGIGQQAYTMRITLYNCVLRITAIFLFIPSTGAEGYLWLLIVSNTFSFIMCLSRILKVSCVRIGFIRFFLTPLVCAASSGLVSRMAVHLLNSDAPMVSAAAGCIVFTAVYFVMFLTVNKIGSRKNI